MHYSVRVLGELTGNQISQLRAGIKLEDGLAKFETISFKGGEGSNHWYQVTLKEGRNREVRRLFEFFNIIVSRLMRIRFGGIALPSNLKKGSYIEVLYTFLFIEKDWHLNFFSSFHSILFGLFLTLIYKDTIDELGWLECG